MDSKINFDPPSFSQKSIIHDDKCDLLLSGNQRVLRLYRKKCRGWREAILPWHLRSWVGKSFGRRVKKLPLNRTPISILQMHTYCKVTYTYILVIRSKSRLLIIDRALHAWVAITPRKGTGNGECEQIQDYTKLHITKNLTKLGKILLL